MNNPIDYNKIAADVIKDILLDVYESSWNWFKKETQRRDFFGKVAKIYGSELWRQHNSIRVFGMSEDIPLESLFVRVNVLEKINERYKDSVESLHKSFDQYSRKFHFGEKRETKEGIQLMNDKEQNKFIVLGRPGAGKSTFLKYLAIQNIKKNSKIRYPKIPIFISLKVLSDKEVTIFEYIEEQFNLCTLNNSHLFIEQLLKKGKAIVLLDGLDEVDDRNKNKIIQNIIDFSEEYHKNTFLISCRVAAYNWWFSKFVDVEIAEFSDSQIKKFVFNWFNEEIETAKSCWKKLDNEPALKELATTPLLLTLLCIVYDENLDFHISRSELYEDAIIALLKKWDSTRRIVREDPIKLLTPARKISLLSRIAAKTFDKGDYFFKRKTLIKLVSEYVENLKGIDVKELENISSVILDSIISNHGIFSIRAKNIYSFSHLTFQEYFTAKYVYEHAAKGVDFRIIRLTNNPRWREVFLLTTSMLDEADGFLLGVHNFASQILNKNSKLNLYLSKLFESTISDKKPSYLQQSASLFISLDRRTVGTFANNGNILKARNTLLSILITFEKYYIEKDNNQYYFSQNSANNLNLIKDISKTFNINLQASREFVNYSDRIYNDSNILSDLNEFLTAKLRLFECLSTECYVTKTNRKWIMNHLFESKIWSTDE